MEKNGIYISNPNGSIEDAVTGKKIAKPIQSLFCCNNRLYDGYWVDKEGKIVASPTEKQLKAGEIGCRIYDTLANKRVV